MEQVQFEAYVVLCPSSSNPNAVNSGDEKDRADGNTDQGGVDSLPEHFRGSKKFRGPPFSRLFTEISKGN